MKSNNTSTQHNEMKKSFVFILNHINVEGKLPIEVAPGHFFKRANDEQIKIIKERLPYFLPYFRTTLPYEVTIVKTPGENQGSIRYENIPLPKENWKYFIISFTGSNTELQSVQFAASLLENDLELGFVFLAQSGLDGFGFGWNPQWLSSFFYDREFSEPAINVASDEINNIFDNYTQIKKINLEFEHIIRALKKFNQLKSLPRNSELIIIGLFSVIESLVTHSPKLTDSADSLTHQIKTKIPLLTKRFERELDYDEYFQLANEDTIWSKLYKYRSNLVHGEHSHIDNTLQVLRDRRNVMEFLKEATKLLLLLALKEPTLLTDLKKC